jgi:hypothetical protein
MINERIQGCSEEDYEELGEIERFYEELEEIIREERETEIEFEEISRSYELED